MLRISKFSNLNSRYKQILSNNLVAAREEHAARRGFAREDANQGWKSTQCLDGMVSDVSTIKNHSLRISALADASV